MLGLECGSMKNQLIGIFLLATVVSTACSYRGAELGEDNAVSVDMPERSGDEAADLAALIDSISFARVPDLDLEMALTLVAMPLSCLDRPHAAPRDRSTYLDETVAARRPAMNATALSTAVGIGIQRSIQPGLWSRFIRNTPAYLSADLCERS